ncbi:eukaryotic translation initiation factor 4Bb isoform X2 [Pimephales promelas]|uniref:eukaryotic translation initiation factor 4Bb isoform X2 n=1 Tax=Pimephales promelas TaxID=90988 RepID=UPI0019556159|nr:eukaryotic translation initiation factor 4Bb isoform X2 [Pimephales promelas]KAG1942557.1 eukaryotic translation initiation factor 4B [Pimephales promelas]
MAASAKKNKKKGKTLTLTDFLANDSGSAPPSYPSAKTTSWADETDDLDGDVSTSWHTTEDTYRAPPIDRSILPTAPRAAREPNVDRSRLPRGPPYTAFLGNLPYDVSEESIKDFFRGLAISAVRLPREPNNPERLKGFGYAEFDDVDSILRALSLNEENLGNRRIRVDIADQSNDKERDGGSMSGRDRDRDRGRGMDGGPDKTDSDWRARPSGEQDEGPRRDEGFGDRSRDRYESDRFRDAPRRDDRFDSGRDRFSGRDRYDDRGSRDYDRGGYDSRGGGGRRGFSSGFRRDFDDRRDGDRYGDREEHFDRRDDGREERASTQRPKLNLKPRSIPKEEEQSGTLPPQINTTSSSRASSIFGAAKPVDTAAKEREVEERLKKEQDRLQRQLVDDKNRGPERRPRDRDPSWRSEEPFKERQRTGSESSQPKGPRSHDGEHSENDVFSGQEDEPISPACTSPSSHQGGLPLKVMPAPPPKENAWAKRSPGGSTNEKEGTRLPAPNSAKETVLGKDENQDHGVQKNKVMSQGRGGGGVGRGGGGGGGGGGGWGRGVDCPTKDKQREPADSNSAQLVNMLPY